MQTIERTALTQLVTNEKYARKVLPFIKAEYFQSQVERLVFEMLEGGGGLFPSGVAPVISR